MHLNEILDIGFMLNCNDIYNSEYNPCYHFKCFFLPPSLTLRLFLIVLFILILSSGRLASFSATAGHFFRLLPRRITVSPWKIPSSLSLFSLIMTAEFSSEVASSTYRELVIEKRFANHQFMRGLLLVKNSRHDLILLALLFRQERQLFAKGLSIVSNRVVTECLSCPFSMFI